MASRSWGGHTAVLSLAVLPPLAPRVLTEGLGTQLRGILEMCGGIGGFGGWGNHRCHVSHLIRTHSHTHPDPHWLSCPISLFPEETR